MYDLFGSYNLSVKILTNLKNQTSRFNFPARRAYNKAIKALTAAYELEESQYIERYKETAAWAIDEENPTIEYLLNLPYSL